MVHGCSERPILRPNHQSALVSDMKRIIRRATTASPARRVADEGVSVISEGFHVVV